MQEMFKQLGLTWNETRLYLALLDLGESTVGPITKRIGMHRQIAYDTLKSLEDQNLVLRTSKNNRFYFRVANPENIVRNVNRKMKTAEKLALLIAEKQTSQRQKQEITIVEGEEAYKDWILGGCDILPSKTELFLIAGNDDNWEDIVTADKTLEKFNRLHKQKKIKVKAVYGKSMRKDVKRLKKEGYSSRFIDDIFLPPTEVTILPNSIDFTYYGAELFVVNIRNQNLRQSYFEYFQKLWKKAKK